MQARAIRLARLGFVALLSCAALLTLTSCTSSDGQSSSGGSASSQDNSSSFEEVDPAENAQADWESQTGDAWDEFASAFEDGGYTACQDFFNQTDNGSMYNAEYRDGEYTASDCEGAFTADASTASYAEIPSEVPDDPAGAGEEAGREEACQEFFDSEGLTELYWGGDTVYTVDDCIGGGSYSSSASPPALESGSGSSGSAKYVACDQNIKAKDGTTTCPFALNTFYEYWRSGGRESLTVWSPKAGRYFDTECTSDGVSARCKTTDGGRVKFPESAVSSYTKGQARAYRGSAELGPGD